MGTDCPECGDEYKQLGTHWQWNPEHRPELTQHQKEVVTGLLMGDGTINRGGGKPYISSQMISLNYLEYLDDIFDCLSTGVRLKNTAKENAKNSRDNNFNPNAKVENYSNTYCWQSRVHPELQEFADWYSSGKKVWPKDIELTSTVLKHWYCGDGCWQNSGGSNFIQISMSNEIENTDKVDSYFEQSNLPKPNNYGTYGHENGGVVCDAYWTVEDSKELWDYMGKPLPDFEYKWPEQYH